MPQDIPIITLASDKGPPTIEIIFGHAHLGTYRFFLWDGQNPELKKHGNNIDNVVDSFTLSEPLASLHQRILSYELIIQAAESGPGQIFSYTVTVRQRGAICEGGVIAKSGPFEQFHQDVEFRRFNVV